MISLVMNVISAYKKLKILASEIFESNLKLILKATNYVKI